MVARQLRWLLVAEALLYAGLGLLLMARAGWTPAKAVSLGTALFFAARALPVALSFAFRFAYRNVRRPSLGVWRTTALFLGELASMIFFFAVIQPFERFWLGTDRLGPGSGKYPPVLLVHGFRCNRGIWFWLRRRLQAAGWQVATVNLEPPGSDIDTYATVLSERIDEVLAATNSSRLILVGHSMGGLVSRAYLRRNGHGKVAGLVTMGSPHHGSRLAMLAWGADGRQMRVGNPWLTALATAPLPAHCVSIYSRDDNQVMPQQVCSSLDGARNVELTGLSHLGMMLSPRMFAELQAALQTI